MVFIQSYVVFLAIEPYFFLGWSFHSDCDFSCLQQNSVISSNTNLGLYGQGLLQLTGDGDTIKGQRLSLSLFYNITVSNYIYNSSYSFIFYAVVTGDLYDCLGLSLMPGMALSKDN